MEDVQKQSSRWFQKLTRRDALKVFGAALAGLTLPLVTGCSFQRENPQTLVKIKVIDSMSHFDPPLVSVPKGSTVVFQNIAIYPQTVTCDPSKAGEDKNISLPPGASAFNSGELYPGQTWTYVFNTPGTYVYFSRYFETPGSVGTIRVNG